MRLGLALIAPLIFISLLFGPTHLFNYQFDDSYITYRYAANLGLGRGLVFNIGDKTDAASSPLYTLILGLLYSFGLTNLEFWGVFINILASIGTAYLVYKAVLNLTGNNNLGLFLSIITSLHGFITTWTASGMETSLFTFFVTLFIYAEYFSPKRNEFLVTSSIIGVILTRIEGAILLFVWLLSRPIKKTLLSQAFISLTIFALFCAFQYYYYGSILPNSFDFKRLVAFYQPQPLSLLKVWAGTSGLILILGTASWFFIGKRLKALYIYLLISFVSFLVGPYSDAGRYSVHILPTLVILSSITLEKITGKVVRYRNFLSFLIMLIITTQTLLGAYLASDSLIQIKQGQICRQKIGKVLNEKAKDKIVLSGDIGLIAYSALNTKFIDITGLTSRDVLNAYQNHQTLDKIIDKYHPTFLADTLLKDEKGKLYHPLLTNKSEYVKGQKVYSDLFKEEDFQNIVYKCEDRNYTYAIVDISSIYK